LDRRYHIELLRRLTRDGAKLVFYDVLFFKDQPIDSEFAQAIRENGAVVLGGDYQNTRYQAGDGSPIPIRQIRKPNPALLEASAGWGLLKVQPLESDFGARRIFSGLPEQDSAVWTAARFSGAAVTRDAPNRLAERWVNFYGPAFWLDQVSLRQALAPDGVRTNFFRDKIVFIGGHPSLINTTGERDVFATPFTRFGRIGHERGFAPGVEMLATAYANLVRGDWLQKISEPGQASLIVLYGIAAGVGLLFVRPWVAAMVAIGSTLGVGIASCYLQSNQHFWWSWMTPVAVQTPLALMWSVGWQYGVERRKRRQLRNAFAAYVSPHLADRIAESEFDLAPGGTEVEVTVMFTDLEKFTNMAEELPPAEVSRILTSYFEVTSREILAQGGMINKYIGDSVMATWGAPLPDSRQAERAVRTAQAILNIKDGEIAGRRLRTRIGISTGLALAGNLGSTFRFDYTVVGATVNLASRLEALNKTLGTEILISESTRKNLGDHIPLRSLGRFQIRGLAQPVRVFEALPVFEANSKNSEWLSLFNRGRQCFEAGEFEQAELLMRKVEVLRAGHDGPAHFFLEQITRLRIAEKNSPPWDGVIRFDRSGV
jgi:adenylate cyclase